jgi:hypothetical protein
MPNIYELHDKAFARVSAFVVARNGAKVATVALKFPADGAGRLYAYVHWIGLEMVRSHAGGYGYDKRSAAIEEAVSKIGRFDRSEEAQERRNAGKSAAAMQSELSTIADNEKLDRFKTALRATGGRDWTRALENAGFTVWQAC